MTVANSKKITTDEKPTFLELKAGKVYRLENKDGSYETFTCSAVAYKADGTPRLYKVERADFGSEFWHWNDQILHTVKIGERPGPKKE